MSYSIEALLFRAAVGVVNTAARAANCALEVMYPREDPGHIWDEGFVSSVAGVAAGDGTAADPQAADPGGVTTTPTSTPPGSLTWRGWAEPAVLEVLSEHQRRFDCNHPQWGNCRCGFEVLDSSDWAEHVAPLICDRIACDPSRAVLALTSLQTQ